MKWLLALLGAIVGGAIGEILGAIVGAVAGWIFGMMLKKGEESAQRKHEERKTQPSQGRQPLELDLLEERVKTLEREVAQLRSKVHRLSQGVSVPAELEGQVPAAAPVPVPAPTPPAPPEPEDLVPELLADLPAMPVPAPVPEPAPAVPLTIEPATASLRVTPPPAAQADETDDGFLVETHQAQESEPEPQFAQAAPPRPPVAPPPPAVPLRDRLPPFISRFIFGGNTIVKVGVLILFLGLAFLLRYAAERVTMPVELRYAGVAGMGAALLALGWRLRHKADAYGLILQGAGIGVFYLTALAAVKLHPLLTPTIAFSFMALVAVLAAVLAVMQNAPWLALVAVLEGFAAPVLVSTGGGNHIALFSYLAILDVGIFLMAWFRAWRPLNLVGFVGTFTLAGGWAHTYYVQALYPSVQAFLLLFFVLFTAIGVLFARRSLALAGEPDPSRPLSDRALEALRHVGRVDSTLAFGVPLAAYTLQYLMVKHDPWGPAWSAFGFGVFYLLLGGMLLRGPRRYSLLGEAYVIVSVIFGTLTIPLALEGAWTGATWAVEAAGMYWLGVRQHRAYARAFAQAVMAGAVLRLVSSLTLDFRPEVPLIAGSVLGMALLCASAFAMHFVNRRAPEGHEGWQALSAFALPCLGVASLDAIAWMLCIPLWASAVTAWLALGCALALRRWPGPALAACVPALHLVALVGLGSTLHTAQGAAMLADGWHGLSAAVLIGAALLATAWLGLRATLRAAAERQSAPSWSLASSAGLLAGLAVLNLSLLFVMPAERAALVWPWVGLGVLWLGLRIAHPALGLAWVALEAAGGAALVAFGWPTIEAWVTSPMGTPFWGALTLTVCGFVAGDLLQRAGRRATGWTSAWTQPAFVHWAVLGWALLWWAQVAPPEIYRRLLHVDALRLWPALVALWVISTSVLMALGARWRAWLQMGQATAATVPLLVLMAIAGPLTSSIAPSNDLGWVAWPLALGWHLLLLRQQPAWLPRAVLQPLHVLGFWLFVLLGARECQLAMASLGAPGSSWQALGWMLVPVAVLVLVTRPAMLKRWPLADFKRAYLLVACGPLALYLLLWLWVANGLPGDAAPLPYLPLLNPLELAQACIVLALVLWLRTLPAQDQQQLPRPVLLGGLGLTAFAVYTGMVLRTCHHWAGVLWDGQALFDSTLTQAALSVAWSVVGVALMLLGHRRFNRLVWAVGAALLGVVVVKLFLVELADRGSLYRIVSFIVVGLLLLLVGYFAPVPPKRPAEDSPASAP